MPCGFRAAFFISIDPQNQLYACLGKIVYLQI